MKVVLCGGGNSTHVMGAIGASLGHEITILTRRPYDWSEDIALTNMDAVWMGGKDNIGGKIAGATADPSTCVPDADIIILAGIPVHHYPAVLKDVCPHIKKDGIMLGSVCSYGGFKWLAEKYLGPKKFPKTCVFGFQSIPWACGTKQYGKRGVVFGAKRELHLAVEGEAAGNVDVRKLCEDLTGVHPISEIDFITCALWPNNPLFHPTVLYGLFKDWDMNTPYKEEDLPKRIYADITDESAACIEKMDTEVQLIVQAFKKAQPENKFLDLARPLKECLITAYGDLIEDSSTMATTLRTNMAYANHFLTYKKVEGGIIPDVTHKFFTTDLPFGLCIYKDFAVVLGVKTPFIDTLIMWNQKMVNKEFMVDGKLTGKNIDEAVRPSKYETFGSANSVEERPAKISKTE